VEKYSLKRANLTTAPSGTSSRLKYTNACDVELTRRVAAPFEEVVSFPPGPVELSSLAGIVRASKPLGAMKSEDKQKRTITNG